MYRDQLGEFVFGYWGLKGYSNLFLNVQSNLVTTEKPAVFFDWFRYDNKTIYNEIISNEMK